LKLQKYIIYALLAVFSFLGSGCVNTLFLPENKALIRKEPVFSGNRHLDDEALLNTLKTRPNRTFVIFPKAYLKVHNVGLLIQKDSSWLKELLLSRDNIRLVYEKGLDLMINKIGEKPKLLDSAQIRADLENMKRIYFSKGYFNAQADYQIKFIRPKYRPGMQAKITFKITEGEVYKVDSVKYRVAQPEVFAPLLRKAVETQLKPGNPYNEEAFSGERQRITELVRNAGFYRFNLSAISFTVDTIAVKNRPPSALQKKYGGPNVRFLDIWVNIPGEFFMYKISEVELNLTRADYLGTPKEQVNNPVLSFRTDTISKDFRKRYSLYKRQTEVPYRMQFNIQESEIHKLSYNFLGQRILLRSGEKYSQKNYQRSLLRLQGMNILRTSVIRFVPDDEAHTLKVFTDLTLQRKNSLRLGVEAFWSEFRTLGANYLPGVGGNVTYRNNNVFRHAEKLEISTKGNISWYKASTDQSNLQIYYAVGARANLSFPHFVFPWRTRGDVSFFNPSTNFILSYDNENRIEFQRQITDVSFSYLWYHIPFSLQQSSQFTPLALSYIRSDLSPAFESSINELSPFLRELVRRDFNSRYTASHIYSFIYSDYAITRSRSTHYFKGTAEVGGLIPFMLDRYLNVDGDYKDGILNGVSYGQFYKISLEGKRYTPLGRTGELVYRAKAGFADPINYVGQVPFESRFYMGGTNSLRGWISNTVGPGTFNQLSTLETNNNLITPGGEIAFEVNSELRRDIYQFLEGALFVDAGNVWFASGGSFQDSRGKLSTETLKLAVDAGIGLRFDFSFLILRLDIAQQLYAPDLEDWVVKRFPSDLGGRRIQYNLGIGYPF
jgi:outer membrane protein assembly factor BamA